MIPESPVSSEDFFPNLGTPLLEKQLLNLLPTRHRAGTVPSRFPGIGAPQPPPLPVSRPTPSPRPLHSGPTSFPEVGESSSGHVPVSSALLSRLRAGSSPQHSGFPAGGVPFGSSVYSSGWSNGRERASTLANNPMGSYVSLNSPSYHKDSLTDADIKTLDYLGLIESPTNGPQGDHLNPSASMRDGSSMSSISLLASIANLTKNANRLRSYSVNATERYAAEEDDESNHAAYYSGTLTPSAEAAAAALAVTQAQIHQHNLEVQAFANQASVNRPRARTAGVLDAPSSRLWRGYVQPPSRLDNSITASDLELQDEMPDYENLAVALQSLHLVNAPSRSGAILDTDAGMQEGQTRALWLGSIPASTTETSLRMIFEPFGAIESARVLSQKSCGFVNFEEFGSAIRAKAQLNGTELFPGAGPAKIGFAKVPSAAGTPGANSFIPSPTPDLYKRGARDVSVAGVHRALEQAAIDTVIAPNPEEFIPDIVRIVKDLGATDEEQRRTSANVDHALQFETYEAEIPSVTEPSHSRVHDAPRLREIRKRIDNNACSPMEIENIAMNMLPEIAELSSDYLGNTVVQKLFESCSESTKEAMLQEIVPHFAEIGVHKNGTWAAQKIIELARTPLQMSLIIEALRPYGVASFNDQYGNYVMQGCLRFQAPYNNFVFDTMLSRLWEVAQGRFGARAMRACLESHHATKDQQRMLAAAIALHSVQLATNANGALLLTWFLDTCTFPSRRQVLAPRLIPHLVHLCTHKVAYLTILKLINQRNEPEARDSILQALFFSPDEQVLEDILRDQSCGATLVFKVLTTPFFDEKIRSEVSGSIRTVLLKLKAQPSQGYKRLMDEVGLSTRNAGGNRDTSNAERSVPVSPIKTSSAAAPFAQQPPFAGGQMNANSFPPQHNQQLFPPSQDFSQQRNASIISIATDSTLNPYSPVDRSGSFSFSSSPTSQMQYQQPYLGSNRAPSNQYGYGGPNMMNGFGGQMAPQMDYRNLSRNGMGPQQNGMQGYPPQQGYAPMMMGMNPGTWQPQYPGAYMMPPQMQPQMMNGGVRRGRVSEVTYARSFMLLTGFVATLECLARSILAPVGASESRTMVISGRYITRHCTVEAGTWQEMLFRLHCAHFMTSYIYSDA